MAGVVVDLLKLALYLLCLRASSLLEPVYGTLIGEVFSGIVLSHFELLPYPATLRHLGDCSLMVVVFLGGSQFSLKTLKGVGHTAVFIVLIGSGLPVLFTWVVFRHFFGWRSLAGVAAGIALSSTAIGITSRLLERAGMLGSRTGVLLQAAAMLDDVVGLVLLGILKQLGGDSGKNLVWIILQPLLVSVGLSLVAVALEGLIPRLDACLSRSKGRSLSLLALRAPLSFSLFLGFTAAADYAGSSYLFGSFLAGVSISKSPAHVSSVEESLGGVIIPWLPRLFFGGTGIAITTDTLFKRDSVVKGIVVTLSAALSKWLSGLAVLRPLSLVNIIGCGMIGRGDIGFLLIGDARSSGIVDEVQHGATVWALLVCTLASPPLFALALKADPSRKTWKEAETIQAHSDMDKSRLTESGAQGGEKKEGGEDATSTDSNSSSFS